jgi:RNA polymerase sigma-70 factor (ECF subfamily)
MSRMVAMEALNRGPAPADRDLWRAVRGRDEAAFRALFIRHSTAVYNYCFRRTASWSTAEDAVQATFATLWRRAAAGKVDNLRLESARPILLAMARNECGNVNRTHNRHFQLVDRVGAQQGTAADNTAAWVESEATMQLIRSALASLPAHQRDVVELVAWSELTMSEAAAALNISVGTVKSRLARARARLFNTDLADLIGESR